MNLSKKLLLLLLTLSLFTVACEDDGDETMGTTTKGALSLEMKDAPVDDASVEAVFITALLFLDSCFARQNIAASR